MKKKILVAMVSIALLFTTHESKAQSAIGLGPGTCSVVYKPSKRVVYQLKQVGMIIFMVFATAGAGYEAAYVEDYWDAICGCYKPRTQKDTRGLYHLPKESFIKDSNGFDVTFTFRNVVFD